MFNQENEVIVSNYKSDKYNTSLSAISEWIFKLLNKYTTDFISFLKNDHYFDVLN